MSCDPQVVVAHLPESSLDTVNSAIFLRFINPAIVSPQSYGLIPQGEVPNSIRRGLTFLSKVCVCARGVVSGVYDISIGEGACPIRKLGCTAQRLQMQSLIIIIIIF